MGSGREVGQRPQCPHLQTSRGRSPSSACPRSGPRRAEAGPPSELPGRAARPSPGMVGTRGGNQGSTTCTGLRGVQAASIKKLTMWPGLHLVLPMCSWAVWAKCQVCSCLDLPVALGRYWPLLGLAWTLRHGHFSCFLAWPQGWARCEPHRSRGWVGPMQAALGCQPHMGMSIAGRL